MGRVLIIALAIISFPKETFAQPLVTLEQMALAQEILTPEQLAAALRAQELARSVGRILTGIEIEVGPAIVGPKILPYLDLSQLDEEIYRVGYSSQIDAPAIVDQYFEAGSSLSTLSPQVKDLLTAGLAERLQGISSQEEARALIKAVTREKWLSLDRKARVYAISFSGLAPVLKARALLQVLSTETLAKISWVLPKELEFLRKFEIVRDDSFFEFRHRQPTTDLFQVILDTRQLARYLGVDELLDHPEITPWAPATLHQHISTLDIESPRDLADPINQYLALKIFASQYPEPFAKHPRSLRGILQNQFRFSPYMRGVIREAPHKISESADPRRREFRRLAFPFEQQQVWIFETYSDFQRAPEATRKRLFADVRAMLDEKTVRALLDLKFDVIKFLSFDLETPKKTGAKSCGAIL